MEEKTNNVVGAGLPCPRMNLDYALVQCMSDFTAECMTELMVNADSRSSTLQKHRAIIHRQDAAELAKKNGATLDDLQKANALAQRTVAMNSDSDYLVFFENDGFQVYRGNKPFAHFGPLPIELLYFLKHTSEAQERGVAVRLFPYSSEYHIRSDDRGTELESIDTGITGFTVEEVGPYCCKDEAPENRCDDSPDGTCSACPHVGDKSKENEKRRNDNVL